MKNFHSFRLTGRKYSLPFTVTIETKIREPQYKVLNNIVFTNERLFKWGLSDSPLCTFCKQEVESFEHIFFYCNVTKASGRLSVLGLVNV